MKKTACPLDCFDACEVEVVDGVCKPSKTHKITDGNLCRLFGYLQNEKQIQSPIPLDETLNQLKIKLQNSDPSKVLYYRGSGNLGVMQHSPKLFFDKYGAMLTHGSLCEEAGNNGIEQDRQVCVNPPIENLINSDVVIVWGRNLTVTSPHIYNLIKDKTFITIDPVKTEIAKQSELHLQIRPKTDHLLAGMFSRFAHLEDLDDQEFIKNNTDGYDWFYELIQDMGIKKTLKIIDVELGDIGEFFRLLLDKKVAILAGIGVQKYVEGEQIMRIVDAFAATMGLFNKDAGGFWYFSDSRYPYDDPFAINPKKTVAMPEVDFGKYDICFIQGANPVLSHPNTKRVIEGLKNTFVVFFGTTDNETAQYANLIIPAKTFLQKKDVRLSYGHDEVVFCDQIESSDNQHISEYELTQYLFDTFGFDGLKSEDDLMGHFKTTINQKPEVKQFEFIEELDVESLPKLKNKFFLLTSKHKNSLCSQFKCDPYLHIHPDNGFNDTQKVLAKTNIGEAVFEIKTNKDIRQDCIILYSGSKVNYLTSHRGSEESGNATYQDIIVELEKVEN